MFDNINFLFTDLSGKKKLYALGDLIWNNYWLKKIGWKTSLDKSLCLIVRLDKWIIHSQTYITVKGTRPVKLQYISPWRY